MLRTADGKEYIDGLSCLWNVNTGHGRKELAQDAAAQMAKLAYASAYAGFSNEPAIRLAEKHRRAGLPSSPRRSISPPAARNRTKAPSSSPATTGSAWASRSKVKIISRFYGYHGVTIAAMSATSLPGYQKMFGPLVPEFLQVPPPYPYRWPGNGDAGIGAADAVEKAILAHGADTIAAVICEPVMGAGGVIVPPAELFPSAARDLRPPRRAADRRRGDHRLRPHRPLVRARALGRGAGHRVVRQGRDVRLRAAGRRHRVEARAQGDGGRADRTRSSCTRRPIPGTRPAAPSGWRTSTCMEQRGPAGAGRRDGASACWPGLETLRSLPGGGRRARAGHDGGGGTGGRPGQPQAGHRPGRAAWWREAASAACSSASAAAARWAARPAATR